MEWAGALTALALGGLGGLAISAVVLVWFSRRGGTDADLDTVAAVVESHGKALRRLTMQRVRSASANPPDVDQPPTPLPPQAGQPGLFPPAQGISKDALRQRVFSSARTDKIIQ